MFQLSKLIQRSGSDITLAVVLGLASLMGVLSVISAPLFDADLWLFLTLGFGFVALFAGMTSGGAVVLVLIAVLLGNYPVAIADKTPEIPILYLAVPLGLITAIAFYNTTFASVVRTNKRYIAVWIVYLASILPSVIFSQDPAIALFRAANLVMAFGIFLLFLMKTRQNAKQLLLLMTIVGASLAVRYIIHLVFEVGWQYVIDPIYRGTVNELPGIGRSNYLASIFVLLIFPMLALSYAYETGSIRRLTRLLGALMVVGLLVTLSRGGMLSALVGFFIFVAYSRRRVLDFRILFLPLIVIVLIFSFTQIDDAILSRFLAKGTFERLGIWMYAIDIFISDWLFGIGLGARLTISGVAADLDVHNILLATLVESGVVGFSGFILFIGTLLYGTYHRLRSIPSSNASDRIVQSGALIGIVASLVHSMIEPNFRGPTFQFLFAALVAVAIAGNEDEQT